MRERLNGGTVQGAAGGDSVECSEFDFDSRYKKKMINDFFTIANDKRAIFGTDILWESCSEFDIESK